jgi:uncharacterized protein (TIRG00374 family)
LVRLGSPLQAPPQVDARTRGRSRVARLVSLAVLVLAVWIVARNVTWKDTLTIGDSHLVGVIDGDWRADEIGFTVTPGQELAPDAPQALRSSLSRILADGGSVRAREGVLLVANQRLDLESDPPEIGWTPGIPHTLEGVRLSSLVPAFLALVASTLFVVTRWWRLLRFEGCPVRWATAFRFTYIGLFFNSFIPGLNGGDVARAIAVVRDQPENRPSALMTVIVDRAFGLVALVLMATAVVLTGDERLDPLAIPVAATCGAMLLGFVAYVTPWLRRAVRFDALLARLPQGERLARLDASARRLLGHPGEVAIALLLSLGNHAAGAFAVVLSARALGDELAVLDWVAVMAIGNTLAAVPISPGGLGVNEMLFGSLAKLLGGSYVLGVATSLLYRVEWLGLAALGGIVMVVGGRRLRVGLAEARRAALDEPERI